MAPARWSSWAKWNQNVNLTLADAQRAFCGDDSLDEARERAKGQSTVLDVHELSAKRGPGLCWVLTPAELHQHFGSKTPSKKAIEAGAASFIARLQKSEAVAVTAYLQKQPCAVLFAGG